jgi:hypothetical protein
MLEQAWWGNDCPRKVLRKVKRLRADTERWHAYGEKALFQLGYVMAERMQAACDLYRSELDPIYLEVAGECEAFWKEVEKFEKEKST